MTLKDRLLATLLPLGFKVDGHPEDLDSYCEDLNGYDCLLTWNFILISSTRWPSFTHRRSVRTRWSSTENLLSRLLVKRSSMGFGLRKAAGRARF